MKMREIFYRLISFILTCSASLSWALKDDDFNETTSFGYQLYKIVGKDIVKGPIGFVAALFFIALGATMVNKSPLGAVGSIIAGAAILNATGLVGTMGLV